MNRGLRALLADSASAPGGAIVTQATAPRILELLRTGEGDADVVMAPRKILDQLAEDRRLAPGPFLRIGSVGVGVMVAAGAAPPDVSTFDAFLRALEAAELIVHNRASTGIYLGQMLQTLEIYPRIADRITVVDDAHAVVQRINAPGRNIGFTGVTEIMHQQDEGRVRFAGPLPRELQKATDYWAAATAGADAEGAGAFLKVLASPGSRKIFADSGVEF